MTLQKTCNLCIAQVKGHHYPYDEHVYRFELRKTYKGEVTHKAIRICMGGHYY